MPEVQRFNPSGDGQIYPRTMVAADDGHFVQTSDYEKLRHERGFWAWKYERRENECEELAQQIRDTEAERDQLKDRLAEFAVLGK